MVKASVVEALADCLDAMRQGADVEARLARYPAYRAELMALLEIASLIRPLPEDVVPSLDFCEKTKPSALLADGPLQPYRLDEDTPDIH